MTDASDLFPDDEQTDGPDERHESMFPALETEVTFPDGPTDDDRRWIVLYPEDHDNFLRDVEGNVGVLVDIEQAGELLRLAAETVAHLSHRDAAGDDVLDDLIVDLERVRDSDGDAAGNGGDE
jgi:hypothetical protein